MHFVRRTPRQAIPGPMQLPYSKDDNDLLSALFGIDHAVSERANPKYGSFLKLVDTERKISLRPVHIEDIANAQRPPTQGVGHCFAILRQSATKNRGEIIDRLRQLLPIPAEEHLQMLLELTLRVGFFLNVQSKRDDVMAVRRAKDRMAWPADVSRVASYSIPKIVIRARAKRRSITSAVQCSIHASGLWAGNQVDPLSV